MNGLLQELYDVIKSFDGDYLLLDELDTDDEDDKALHQKLFALFHSIDYLKSIESNEVKSTS